MRNGETLGCEMHWQIARSGHGPLSFWRTIGVVRPRNWIVLVLWTQSLTGSGWGGGGGCSSWRSSSLSGCSWSLGEDDDAISMLPDLLPTHTTPQYFMKNKYVNGVRLRNLLTLIAPPYCQTSLFISFLSLIFFFLLSPN